MSKSTKYIAALVITFAILGMLAVITGGNSQETAAPETENSVVSNSDTSPAPTTSIEEKNSGGKYIEYDEQAIANASGTQRVLFFHAEWCSTCRFYESDIEKAGVPEGITIIKASYDNEPELRKRYNVNIQSTFVLLNDDETAVRTWPFASGLKDANDLYENVKAEG